MPSQNFMLLAQAIDNKKTIEFEYDNHQRRARPYLLGHDEQGNEKTSVYQFGGTSSSEVLSWKCMEVQKIENLNITNDKWDEYTGYPYNPLDRRCVKQVTHQIKI